MKIAFISKYAFPIGMASTNRLTTLAQGLLNHGNYVKIYCIRPSENRNNPINKLRKGVYKGIHFQYTPNLRRSPFKIIRAIAVLFGLLRLFPLLIKDSKGEKYHVIISSATSLRTNCPLMMFCRLQNILLFSTLEEYPHVVRTPQKYPKWFRDFYLRIFPKLFDGIIVMTKTLESFFKPLCKSTAFFVHIPMTVDFARFQGEKPYPPELAKNHYIAYCGTLGYNNKDGVDILIKAFAKIKNISQFKCLKLAIIGGFTPGDKSKIEDLLNLCLDLKVKDDVIFTGKIHKDDIPNYLVNAKALCLARPNNIQAQGGFPTKLGEYLSTGNPVIVTKVGEIEKYLNEDSAYLSEPDSVENFSLKLIEALTDKNSKIIGNNGRYIAMKTFSHEVQGDKLNNKLLTILSKNINLTIKNKL